jgi:hypothetical protein
MPNTHGDQPASRADVLALDEKMERRLQRIEDKIAQSQATILEATQEMVRDAQTELLRGYASFAESQEIRMRKMTADISNIDASTNLRMVVLERRLLEIEKRLHIPPPPRAS